MRSPTSNHLVDILPVLEDSSLCPPIPPGAPDTYSISFEKDFKNVLYGFMLISGWVSAEHLALFQINFEKDDRGLPKVRATLCRARRLSSKNGNYHHNVVYCSLIII